VAKRVKLSRAQSAQRTMVFAVRLVMYRHSSSCAWRAVRHMPATPADTVVVSKASQAHQTAS